MTIIIYHTPKPKLIINSRVLKVNVYLGYNSWSFIIMTLETVIFRYRVVNIIYLPTIVSQTISDDLQNY